MINYMTKTVLKANIKLSNAYWGPATWQTISQLILKITWWDIDFPHIADLSG